LWFLFSDWRPDDWAPEQVRGLTIGPAEAGRVNQAKQAAAERRANVVRCGSDFSSNKINGKIQEAEQAKVHTPLSSAVATWAPATFPSACTAKATSARSQRG
jgi:hypothetical protein